MNNEWEVWTVTGLDVLHEIQNAGFLVALTNLLNYKPKENKTVSQPKGRKSYREEKQYLPRL